MDLSQPMTGLALEIRQAYIVERERYIRQRTAGGPAVRYVPGVTWDGGRDGAHRLHQPIWPKIADFVQQHQLDAATFVRRQFLFWNSNSPPQPNQLLSARALENYHQGETRERSDIELAFPIQQTACRVEFAAVWRATDWTEREVWGNVLTNETLPMTALFRYCMAVKVKHGVVARQYCRDAAYQYVPLCHEYDRVWKDWIPDAFKNHAGRLYYAASRAVVAGGYDDEGNHPD